MIIKTNTDININNNHYHLHHLHNSGLWRFSSYFSLLNRIVWFVNNIVGKEVYINIVYVDLSPRGR